MAFTDQESLLTPGRALAGIGGVLLIALLSFGLRSVSGSEMGLVERLFHRNVTPEQMAARLEARPELRGMLRALRTHYPEEHEDLFRQVSATANAEGEAAAGREAFYYMRGFSQAKADFVTSAPAAELRQLAGGILEMIETLERSSVPDCARFVTVGFGPGERHPPEVIASAGRTNVLLIRAARSAEDGRSVARGALGEADAVAWLERLEALDPASASLLATDRLLAATPAEQCEAGIAIYQAALALPEEASANVIAELIRESIRSTG